MGTTTVDAYVHALPAAQREIVDALRRIVLDAAPQATESIKWAQPVFEHQGPFAYIKAYKACVNIGFWRGVELDRQCGLLQSGGDRMAHVSLRTPGDINRSQLVALIKDAVKLNEKMGDPTKRRPAQTATPRAPSESGRRPRSSQPL